MKNLPIGIENFKELRDKDYYYVDKTDFIKDVWQEKVALYTRPRRFGKTLNMSMLYYFFSIKQREHAYLFNGLKIMDKPDVADYQNQYPVIMISLKDMKWSDYNMQIEKFAAIISNVVLQNKELLDSSELDSIQINILKQYKNRTSSVTDLVDSLYHISACLNQHYHKKVMILIDEYDVPLQSAYLHGYYDQMAEFLSGMFSAALKTNDVLERGIMTGCLRISRESIFAGLNNFKVYSIFSGQSSACFGFTPEETMRLMEDYGLKEYETIAREWYDGYVFGECEIYNPWSILNYVHKIIHEHDSTPESFWANTSSNDLVYRYIQTGSEEMKQEFGTLSTGGTIRKTLRPELTYREMDDVDHIYSFLLFTGYLKMTGKTEDNEYCLQIPNKEIRYIYTSIFEEWFRKQITGHKDAFIKALKNEEIRKANEIIAQVLFSSISYYDYDEKYYHGFLTGMLQGSHRITSNQEAGLGRYDIAVLPLYRKARGLLFECKVAESESDLEKTAMEACKQISERKYIEGLKEQGYTDIIGYGISFYKKSCMIVLCE